MGMCVYECVCMCVCVWGCVSGCVGVGVCVCVCGLFVFIKKHNLDFIFQSIDWSFGIRIYGSFVSISCTSVYMHVIENIIMLMVSRTEYIFCVSNYMKIFCV